MSTDKPKNSHYWPERSLEFNFTEWQTLYQDDPVAFERKRKEWVESTIASAPDEYQRRLKGLMFKVDVARDRSKSPVQSCLEISKMMWNSATDLRTFLDELQLLLSEPTKKENESTETAQIYKFGQ